MPSYIKGFVKDELHFYNHNNPYKGVYRNFRGGLRYLNLTTVTIAEGKPGKARFKCRN